MALLATPSLGILISALTLGEAVGTSLITGVVLIGIGIRLAISASDGEKKAAPSEGRVVRDGWRRSRRSS
jgi:hypothetical protein